MYLDTVTIYLSTSSLLIMAIAFWFCHRKNSDK